MVQIMIAAAMAGGLSLVIMNLMQNSQKTQRSIEVNQSLNEVFNRISSYIQNTEICSRVFQVAPGEEIEKFKIDTDPYSTSGIVLEKGVEIGNTKIITEKMELLDPPSVIDESKGIYDLTFRVSMMRKKGSYYMSGTTKFKHFTFSAKLCQPSSPSIYITDLDLQDKIDACNDECAADSDCKYAYTEPEFSEAEPGGYGAFLCWKCGPKYSVSSCNIN